MKNIFLKVGKVKWRLRKSIMVKILKEIKIDGFIKAEDFYLKQKKIG